MTLSSIFERVAGKPVEDRTYNIGEISQKTGLQKTANGWVKPKSGGASPNGSGGKVEKFVENNKSMWQKNVEKAPDGRLKELAAKSESKNAAEKEVAKMAKAELEKRNSEKEFKVQGMPKEEYIPWRMTAHGESEAQATSMWSHMEAQEKNKKKRDFDHSSLRDSAPRALTGDCKVRIRK